MHDTTMLLTMSQKQKDLITKFAERQGVAPEELLLEKVLEAIEDHLDSEDWEEAYAEFQKDPRTFSAQEIADRYLNDEED